MRVLRHFRFALWLLAASLGAGMAGYLHYEDLAWRVAFLNARMLLGGMGPVDDRLSEEGELVAGIYALYAGLVSSCVLALILAPVVHRILHRFRWEESEDLGSRYPAGDEPPRS